MFVATALQDAKEQQHLRGESINLETVMPFFVSKAKSESCQRKMSDHVNNFVHSLNDEEINRLIQQGRDHPEFKYYELDMIGAADQGSSENVKANDQFGSNPVGDITSFLIWLLQSKNKDGRLPPAKGSATHPAESSGMEIDGQDSQSDCPFRRTYEIEDDENKDPNFSDPDEVVDSDGGALPHCPGDAIYPPPPTHGHPNINRILESAAEVWVDYVESSMSSQDTRC